MTALNLFYPRIFRALLFSILFANNLITTISYASPHPASGSSLLVAPEQGLFWKRFGFQLKAGATGWNMASLQNENDFQARYMRPNSTSGSLAVRIETLKSDLTLESYTKKWMRDYTSYGFEVLGTNSFQQNGAKGLVIDLVHKKADYQLRQVLFLKNKRVVILTCRDQQKKFQQTLIGCNQISRTFEWSNSNRAAAF